MISELKQLEEPAAPAQAPPTTEVLSEREVEVLRLMGSGASNREIASRLY